MTEKIEDGGMDEISPHCFDPYAPDTIRVLCPQKGSQQEGLYVNGRALRSR